MTQRLSSAARKRKLARDLAAAKTPSRRRKKAENQRLRRAAKKRGLDLKEKDFDHTKRKFVSVEDNRGQYGKGTKK